MNEKINIETGDDSTNITGKTVNVTNIFNQGLTEEKVTEIIDKKLEMLSTVQVFTQEACKIAESRVKKLEEIVIPRIAKIDETLGIFADPSFQSVLNDAVKVAAQTDEIESYKLLSELLAHKVEKPNDKSVKMDVSYAIDVIDKITEEALQAITVFVALQSWSPTSGIISQGVATINNIYSRLLFSNLPTDDKWIDQLDILKVIRIQSFGEFPSLIEFQKRLFSGYVVCGIPKNSEKLNEIYQLMDDCSIPRSCLIENELDSNYYRLPLVNINNITEMDYFDTNTPFIHGRIRLNEKQISNIKKIISYYENEGNKLQEISEKFNTKWNSFENLKKIGEWWTKLPCAFGLTSIGKVLAITNAQRIDSTLPKIDL